MDLLWHALNTKPQAKALYHTEKQGFGYPWLSKKNSRYTHQNLLRSSPVSGSSPYPLQNYVCFSPLTSGLESFGHKSTPSDRPRIEAYCPKIELRPRMPKGQLSRVPWPGNSWMPFTFQPALWAPQQPH